MKYIINYNEVNKQYKYITKTIQTQEIHNKKQTHIINTQLLVSLSVIIIPHG